MSEADPSKLSEHVLQQDIESNFRPTAKLSKKRSFLLVDVLEDIEGTRDHKRQDTHETCSTRSTDSIEINVSSNKSLRQIRRQRSDFDVLYANSRSQQSAQTTLSDHDFGQSVQLQSSSSIQPLEGTPHALSKRNSPKQRLRSKKSMIALSLERLGTNICKSRLDGIDTNEITSFDTVLQKDCDLKAEPAGVCLDTTVSRSPLALANHRINLNPLEAHPSEHIFARNTELLKQLPDTTTKSRRVKRPLRYAKSAKDILERYKTDSRRSEYTSSGQKDEATQDFDGKRSKAETLRGNLRSLLGLKREGNKALQQ
jgi:hypothetical protein